MGSFISLLKKPEYAEVTIPSFIIDKTPRILYYATRFKFPLTYTIKEEDREIAYSIIKSINTNKSTNSSITFYLDYNIYKKIPYLKNILKKNNENNLFFLHEDKIYIACILLEIGKIQKEKYPNMRFTYIKKNKIYPI
jgi:hypothetical protein